ncbi:recombinase family protein, partial [Klebsiella pneumoniae]|uniref:recombinase family protein n=1 Tax=Klebsiella pneumoniae TaxID=573 RepID=UPI00163DBE85
KDISKKVSTEMKAKRLRGEYIGNYAPYGYLKDPNNKNHLIIDKEVANIVVEIFELRATGIGIAAIAKIINEKGYPSPGRLRYERGIMTNNNQKGSE